MKNDGGPAFPSAELTGNYHETVQQWSGGMTLRDYFAAAALTGLYANSSEAVLLAIGTEAQKRGEKRQSETYVREAYEAADAMLAERAK